jgi:hypothetical protein
MPRSGAICVVFASNSMLLPRGPFKLQWLVSSHVMRTSLTLDIKVEKFSKLDQ